MKFNEKDFQTVRHALIVAAECFERDAKVAAKIPGHDRLRDQFELQAKDSRELAERIEQEAP